MWKWLIDIFCLWLRLRSFFAENTKVLEKGETAARKNNRVSSCYYDDTTKVINGLVDPSLKRNKYKVAIYLTSEYKIEKATCECPNGQHRCSHMAALAVTAYDNPARIQFVLGKNFTTRSRGNYIIWQDEARVGLFYIQELTTQYLRK